MSGKTLFSAKNITLASPGGAVLLNKGDIAIVTGQIYGLLGPNGSGKTTLLRHMRETVGPSIAGHMNQIDKPGPGETIVDVVLRNAMPLAYAEYVKERNGEDEYDHMLALDAHTETTKIISTLVGLGFTDMSTLAASLSGGWKQRLLLAAAIYTTPVFLALDEPTNQLDICAVIWLQGFLRRNYGAGTPRALIVVTHDIEFLSELCTSYYDIVGMSVKEYRMKFGQYLIERELANTTPKSDKYVALSKIDKRMSIEAIRRQIEILNEVKPLEFLHTGVRNVNVVVSNFNKAYDAKVLYKNFDMNVSGRGRYYIVGPNGVGKTTLLDHIAETAVAQHATVGYYKQTFDELLAVKDRKVRELFSGSTTQRIFGTFALYPFLDREVGTLSGGQMARVSMALISQRPTSLLILDEPTNHLDSVTIDKLIDAIRAYPGPVVCVTHDYRLFGDTDHVYTLGKIPNTRLERTNFSDYIATMLHELDQEISRIQELAEQKQKERVRKHMAERRSMIDAKLHAAIESWIVANKA